MLPYANGTSLRFGASRSVLRSARTSRCVAARSVRLNSTSSSNSAPAGVRNSQNFAYGLLASVAAFSSVFGYSVSEWRRKSLSPSATVPAKTWQEATYGSQKDIQAAIAELRTVLPDENAVMTEASVLQTYGYSENSYHPSAPHSVVLRVKSTEEVSAVVKIANKYKIPITAYGGGTSLEGHFSGVRN